MGGKTSKSTQTVSIPPEVLARYNAVNARAEQAAGTPFQPYSYNPADFAAQLTPTQLAGIQNVNYAAGQAQPYYDEATGQLMGAQMAAVPYYGQAEADIYGGQQMGQQYQQQALNALYGGQYGAVPFQQAAAYNIGAAQDIGAQLAQQAYAQQALAGAGAMPLQQAAYGTLGRAGQMGEAVAGQALGSLAGAGYAAQPLQQLAQGIYGQAYQAAQPYTQMALQQYFGGLGGAAPISQAALANLAAGQQMGQDVTGMALSQLGLGQMQAAPIQQAAIQAVGAAPFAAAPLTGAAQQNILAAQAGFAPYQQAATQLGLAGARAVTPTALGAPEIQQYMSPYLSNVVGQTQALLNQQAQQAQAEQLGNAIRSGAFGGDRAAIAAANLQQQQQLAQGKVLGDLLQSGYGQALATAQQQQQLGLTAEQANRAAQQQAAAQLLGVGQTGFGQGMTAAQQQAALAQQLYGQQLGAGQAQAALAQQLFGQGATAAQQQQAAAQALFGQSAQAAQQQAALAQQIFGQQAATGQNIAGLGQQAFGQGLSAGQAQQALAQQLFGQGATTAQQQAAIAQALFGQGATQAQQQAALGQQIFGQGLSQAQQQAALSQLLYGQGTGAAQQQAALGQQIFGQGLSAAQQQAALGQQGFAQQLAAAQARQGLGQGLYGMGAGTAQQLAALGAGAQGAALSGAQAQLAAGQAQQQTAQAGLQALYNQFLQQQAYPFQAAQFLANVAMGTGALSGSTQTAVTPGGLLSDVRMKENIRKVGETFDKQPIYSYNYKGDDRTQMGMLAQEVEQRHPEAVGLAGGMKTVDYDKATRDSRKPVTIDGEYTASEGGPVSMAHAGERYARGGYADGGSPGLASPSDMAALLAAQAQMFGPFSQSGRQTGGLPGGQGYIPQANLPVSELVTPGAMPEAPDAIAQMQKIADIGKTGTEIYEKYKEKQAKKSAANALNTPQANAIVSSSRMMAADGGSAAMPYSDNQTTQLNIPTEKMEVKKLETPAMPQGRSAMDDVAAIANIAATVMSMSDSRVKEDIKHIGHTYDGQKIYSYRYKGEPQTHIGLLAQEVEKKHPDAVGNIGGLKTVDYDMATEDAARKAVNLARGRADGGGVMPYSSPTSLGIPTQSINVGKLSVPDMPEGKSALDDLSKLASTASDIKTATTKPKKASGGVAGRKGYQTRGSVLDEFLEGMESFAGAGQGLNPYSGAPGINAPSPAGTSYKRGRPWWERAGLFGAENAPASATPPAAETPTNLAASTNLSPQKGTDKLTEKITTPSPIKLPARRPAGVISEDQSGLAGGEPAAPLPVGTTQEQESGRLGIEGGLAPAKGMSSAEAIAKNQSAPTESRMNAFLDWVRQPENFIPLATGVAAATAAPTRNTFVALAQGLGAGAQAYLPVRQKQAETRETLARAQQQETQTLRDIANIPAGALVRDSQGVLIGVRVFGPNNEIIMLPYRDYRQRMAAGESFRFVPSVPGVTTAGTPGQAPMGAPTAPVSGPTAAPQALTPAGQAPAAVQAPVRQAPIYESLPEDLRRDAVNRAENVMGASPTRLMQDPTANPFTDSANVATGARAGRPQRDQLALALSTAGPISGKFAATFSNPLFEYLETGLRSFGFAPGIIRSPDLLASEQEIKKITNQMAQSQQAALGGTAFREFMSLMEAIPTTANTPEAQAKLLAGIYVVPQMGIDRDNFFNLMRNEMEQSGGIPADMSMLGGRGLDAEFAKRQAPVYIKEKDILAKMFLMPIEVDGGDRTTLMSYLIKNGAEAANDPDMIELLRKTFPDDKYDAANILRYFGAR